jgi:hypothetical protein
MARSSIKPIFILVTVQLIGFLFGLARGYGHSVESEGYGAMIGVTITFGTAINRLGLTAGGYLVDNRFQANMNVRWHYNYRSLGPSLAGPETVISLGGLYGWGAAQEKRDALMTAVSNHTGRRYGLAYAYNYYFDHIGTSQPTGTVALEIDRFQLVTENDILGLRGGDRYRTGALLLAYQSDREQIAINTTLWTGNATKRTRKVRDSGYPSRHGYMDMTDAHYGHLSHGLLSLQYTRVLDRFQTIQVRLGVDAEQVRHVFQNRIMHDMYPIPDDWIPQKNHHVPMLDDQGRPYLFGAGQRIRPARLYFDLSVNPSIFY